MRLTTKRSKNLSKAEYIEVEKKFLWRCAKKQIQYWPPLQYENLGHLRKQLNAKDFPSEVWFFKQLIRKKIKGFLRNWPIGNRFFGDFFFYRANIVVEIDGDEHNREMDRRRDRIAAMLGIKTFRIKRGDNEEMFRVLKILELNPYAKQGFKLMRKKPSEKDMYDFFPPSIIPERKPPQKPKKFVSSVIIRKANGLEKKI